MGRVVNVVCLVMAMIGVAASTSRHYVAYVILAFSLPAPRLRVCSQRQPPIHPAKDPHNELSPVRLGKVFGLNCQNNQVLT
jgi:hypothetical protein